jgi:general secretion pathway protein A
MYQEFYGLREKPFSLTPDSQFLYLSESHRTAIDSFLYGIDQRAGFVVMTGDAGTGKTTICRATLEKIDKNVKTAVIFNSLLSERELLVSILQDFGLASKGRSKKELIDELNKFLLDQLSQGKNAAIIIDEAQNLSIPVLEQIRMLSNLETEKEKMLQIVLLGQLELEQKLQSPELRQLSQRVTIKHRLLPLSQKETEHYINQRLAVAGGQGNITFSRSAINEIYRFSKGIPRLINLICDRALLGGFVDQTYYINRKIIQRARKSLAGNERTPRHSSLWTLLRRPIPLPIVFLVIFLVIFICIGLSNQTTENLVWNRVDRIYEKIANILEYPRFKIEGEQQLPRGSTEVHQGGLFE